MAKLTKRVIDALQPAAKDYVVFDDELPGFGVRVLPTGRKSFLVQYRSEGRSRRVTLGRFGTLTADEGRKMGLQVLGTISRGRNPASDIKEYRGTPTLSDVCDRFLREHVNERLKPTTRREYQRCVELFIRPALGTYKIVDVTRADVYDLHRTHSCRPYQANRILGVLSKLFNLAEVWCLRPDGSNPTRHVPKYKESKRERFLSEDELRSLGRTLDRMEAEHLESPHVIAAYKLLILTGCRLREIQTLKWSYVQSGRMILPDSKTGPRRIPLPPDAQAILDALPRLSDNDYVIVGKEPGQYITDLQRPWRRIRELAGIDDVRIHDLRHTYASMAVMQGINITHVAKILGHTQIQTTMRYAHLADAPVREAAQEVSSTLGSLIGVPSEGAHPHLRVVQ